MKKLLVLFIFIVLYMQISARADILPNALNPIDAVALGMYQVPKHVVIYAKPDLKSDIVFEADWNFENFKSSKGSENTFFSVFVKEKELGFIEVIDFTDDWLKVLFDKDNKKTGWIKSEDIRFLTWRNFYNLYGRKYGLYTVGNIPDSIKELRTDADNNSKVLGKIVRPFKINLIKLKGNWALVRVFDVNDTIKIGYLRWRSDEGKIYFFPSIK